MLIADHTTVSRLSVDLDEEERLIKKIKCSNERALFITLDGIRGTGKARISINFYDDIEKINKS